MKEMFLPWLLIVMLISLIVALAPGPADAATVRLDFDTIANPANLDSLTLWERVDAGRIALVEDIPPTDTSVEYTAEPPTECRTFFLTSYSHGAESLASNPVAWCPETSLPVKITRPATVNITIEIME